MKKILAAFLACLMVIAMFTSCTSTENYNQSGKANTVNTSNIESVGDTIVIGAIVPETGSFSSYGLATLKGIKLAADEINAAGGILGGKKIILDVKDDQGNPDKAFDAFNTLVADNITLIVSTIPNEHTSAITDLANSTGAILISVPLTENAVTTEADYIFSICNSDSRQGAIAAKYAKDNGFEKVGALYCASDDYSKSLFDAFSAQCKKYGIEIVIAESTQTVEDTEYLSQWTEIANSKVEFVFAPYNYNTAGPYVIPQARNAGYNGIIMGADGYDGSIAYIRQGSDLSAWENVLFTNHNDLTDTNEKVVNFIKAFKTANNGDAPDEFAVLGYDALNTLIDAIVCSGTADADTIKNALADTTAVHEGVTGNFTLDEAGISTKEYAVMTFMVVDGKVITKLDSIVSNFE